MEINETQPDCESDNGTNEVSDWYDENSLDSFDEKNLQGSSEKVFCFETDHAALLGNSDYHLLMKTFAILQVQRVKVIQDIQKLQKIRSEVRHNPKEYLRRFLDGDISDMPSEVKIQKVPDIDWSKYKMKSTNQFLINSQNINEPSNSFKKEVECKTIQTESDNMTTVRGRVFDQNKSRTFNQVDPLFNVNVY